MVDDEELQAAIDALRDEYGTGYEAELEFQATIGRDMAEAHGLDAGVIGDPGLTQALFRDVQGEVQYLRVALEQVVQKGQQIDSYERAIISAGRMVSDGGLNDSGGDSGENR